MHVLNWTRWHEVPTLPELEKRPVRVKEERAAVQKNLFEPLLADMKKKGLLDGLDVRTSVLFGRPSEVLSELAAKEGDDVIVVARTGDSNLKQAIFGSTASRLVQHAPVPVIVVP